MTKFYLLWSKSLCFQLNFTIWIRWKCNRHGESFFDKILENLTFCILTILSVTRSWTSFEANPYVFTWRRWCGAPWWPWGGSPPTGTPRSPRSASWSCCTRPAAACYPDSHYKRQIFVEQLYKTQQHCCVV